MIIAPASATTRIVSGDSVAAAPRIIPRTIVHETARSGGIGGDASLARATSASKIRAARPRMNLDSCAGCHSQPAVSGSSPAINPQFASANQAGGTDRVPPFLSSRGPVREARFVLNPDGTADGGVHALFTITGRIGADGCSLAQPDFA